MRKVWHLRIIWARAVSSILTIILWLRSTPSVMACPHRRRTAHKRLSLILLFVIRWVCNTDYWANRWVSRAFMLLLGHQWALIKPMSGSWCTRSLRRILCPLKVPLGIPFMIDWKGALGRRYWRCRMIRPKPSAKRRHSWQRLTAWFFGRQNILIASNRWSTLTPGWAGWRVLITRRRS